MARETKDERVARELARAAREHTERLLFIQKMKDEWPSRLVYNLQRATHHKLDLMVKDGNIFVRYDSNGFAAFPLFPTFSSLDPDCDAPWDALQSLENELDWLDQQVAETIRVDLLRRQARAKLSKEELEALGLKA